MISLFCDLPMFKDMISLFWKRLLSAERRLLQKIVPLESLRIWSPSPFGKFKDMISLPPKPAKNRVWQKLVKDMISLHFACLRIWSHSVCFSVLFISALSFLPFFLSLSALLLLFFFLFFFFFVFFFFFFFLFLFLFFLLSPFSFFIFPSFSFFFCFLDLEAREGRERRKKEGREGNQGKKKKER